MKRPFLSGILSFWFSLCFKTSTNEWYSMSYQVIYRDRDLTVDKGIKNPWKCSWLETEVLNDRCEIPMGKWSTEQESWNGVGCKSSQKIKGPTHQKASEEKANKSWSTVYCNCACKLTNKPHFYNFKRYIVSIYITLYASLGFIWCLKFNINLQLKRALDPRWWLQ